MNVCVCVIIYQWIGKTVAYTMIYKTIRLHNMIIQYNNFNGPWLKAYISVQ